MLLRWLLLLVAITLSRAQDTPTEVPSAVPTVMPTVNPSETPTKTPSAVPTTAMPTAPIETPTATPTATPTTATPTTAVPTLIEDCRTYPLFSNCSSCVEDGHHWCSDGGGYGDYCFNGNDDACFEVCSSYSYGICYTGDWTGLLLLLLLLLLIPICLCCAVGFLGVSAVMACLCCRSITDKRHQDITTTMYHNEHPGGGVYYPYQGQGQDQGQGQGQGQGPYDNASQMNYTPAAVQVQGTVVQGAVVQGAVVGAPPFPHGGADQFGPKA